MRGIFEDKKSNNLFKDFLKFKNKKLKNKAHKHRIMPKGKSVIKKI